MLNTGHAMANESEPRTRERPEAPVAAPQNLPAATGFVAKARDLDALRIAVVDAASVGAGLWFSYLFVLLYLLIAAGSVTHRDLLYASPIRLPFLSVDLPLVGFFVLGPLLFLIVHAYVLLHLVLLASKVGVFHAELEAQIADEDTRTRLRRQLPSNIFVQYLAGPREVRTGIIGTMLRLIAQISLVAGPLGLLVFFLLQFLPYHHEGVTWWHRFAVLADLALLWMLWPSVARGTATWIAWRDFRTGKIAALALASLVPLFLVFTIATFPSEWLDTKLPSIRFIPSQWPSAKLAQQGANNSPRVQGAKGKGEAPSLVALIQSMGWTSLHELLVGGDVNRVFQRPTSLWSNRLVLPEIDLVDRAKFDTEEKIKAAVQTFALRGRRLEGAVLIRAQLRKVDLVGAQLQGAFLYQADLREAKLGCGIFGDICANLQGAELFGAKLQGTDLVRARLRGAELREAQLQGANLAEAQLQGANLSRAQLQGADLTVAHLQGAYLVGAQLQGANLKRAHLQGADLSDSDMGDTPLAGLQGAQLGGASLQGAKLRGTRLQGADLTRAQLQGADLTRAGLEGTNLTGARLRGALLDQVSVWRADPRAMIAESARIINPNKNQQSSAIGFGDLKRLMEEQVPKGERHDAALKRIEILDVTHLDEKNDAAIFDEWDRLAKHPLPDSEYEPILTEILQQIGCAPEWGSYAIRGWHSQFDSRFSTGSSHAARLEGIFLDETRCPRARDL
jgi:uncharacterized protein YjbI with pentapeptide repeats